MYRNAFGDYRFDSLNDNLGDCLEMLEVELDDVYAIIESHSDGTWGFEVRNKDDGEDLVISQGLFETQMHARGYLERWLDPDSIEVEL